MSTVGTSLEAVRRRAGAVISEEGRDGRIPGVVMDAWLAFSDSLGLECLLLSPGMAGRCLVVFSVQNAFPLESVSNLVRESLVVEEPTDQLGIMACIHGFQLFP